MIIVHLIDGTDKIHEYEAEWGFYVEDGFAHFCNLVTHAQHMIPVHRIALIEGTEGELFEVTDTSVLEADAG